MSVRILGKPVFAILLGCLFVVLGWVILARRTTSSFPVSQQTSGTLQVMASFYPLADLAKNIGGSQVEVTTMTPTGVEPHDYEPTPQDLAKVYQAKLVLLNGNGLDAWGDRLLTDLRSKHIPVIRMSDALVVLPTDGAASNKELYDPHVWLDPQNVIREADLVSDALSTIDPSHAQTYAVNRDVYTSKLMQLDADYRAGLMTCQTRELFTSHNAFRYLARRYGLVSSYLQGLSPEEDPSPQTMANLANRAKRERISYVFFETLVNPKLAETLAQEIGAKTLLLNPIEGLTAQDVAAGKDYLQLMRDNLANLRLALRCT